MTPREERALLLAWRPWLRKVARGMTVRLRAAGHDIAEDLAQEGWIALWEATRTYDGRNGVELDYWLKRCAHDRMRVVLRLLMAKCRDIDATQLAGNPWDDTGRCWDALTTNLTDLEFAYHHGEIAQAMASLTPRQREYVYLRYYRGYGTAELTKHFGYLPKTIGQQVRRNLAAKLAHLSTV